MFSNFNDLPKVIRRILFRDILSNAGEYWKSDDPGNGVVSFLTPKHIEPVYSALKFYQRFVFAHPFYDANGRIGRFIVTLYLHYHGFFIDWQHLERNERWLKTLNACHDRMNANEYVYEKYIGYMVTHWNKSINRASEDE